jgi:hypothetical protein
MARSFQNRSLSESICLKCGEIFHYHLPSIHSAFFCCLKMPVQLPVPGTYLQRPSVMADGCLGSRPTSTLTLHCDIADFSSLAGLLLMFLFCLQ